MKKNMRFGLFLVIICCFGLTNLLAVDEHADKIIGVWKTGSGKGMVKIYKENDKYHGKLVWLKEPNDENGKPKVDKNNGEESLRSRSLLGLINLRDFTYKGDKVWEDGKIYDPENGSDYSCEMKLTDDNTLEVRGFIGVSLFGRTDVWKRQVKK
ncbi:MAG: DUF2147 domain-containing protein [Thermoflexibacter sp.]|jgi:uncharacterized protein (DUF2147 family)|nr:DUF2147 domain-containing protein [Thermoflexibacter sp.]